MPRQSLVSRWKRLRARNKVLSVIVAAFLLEWTLHLRSFEVSRPPIDLRDKPFFTKCQEPDVNAPRENAVIVMLARNDDAEKASETIASLEKHFNQWFQYPILFLNDVDWEQPFIDRLSKQTTGNVSFEVIPQEQWSYPGWIDQEKAKQSMKKQEARGMLYAGLESYHHMCRFNSGKFFDHPALKGYKWFWRVDSDIEFTCHITYDPFERMAASGKKYGYAMALWERGDTCPTLFREVDRYRKQRQLPYSGLFTALIEPSWGPLFFRKIMSWFAGRNDDGDKWSHCHFWSNFEIGDMDFFRSKPYRDYFDYLDRSGGFYFERWGDAPVHSFGAALLLEPHEVHWFEDLGYIHDNIQYCPQNAKGGQLAHSEALGKGGFDAEKLHGVGCRCKCNSQAKALHPECQNILGRAMS
ncbi:MAG: hypothetical protein MMC23_006676 [Stictis urceolatum]|nr:hypothetical protein [Stictis urceolata]